MLVNEDILKHAEARASEAKLTGHGLHETEAAVISIEREIARPINFDEEGRTHHVIRERVMTNDLRKRMDNLAYGEAKPSAREVERLLNGDDLVDEFYLRRALVASKPVCKISVRNSGGRELGCATGFLVAPEIVLTNWHVFESASDAEFSLAEFNYTRDIKGNDVPSYKFSFRPDLFFFLSKTLDYALVAVNSLSLDQLTALNSFGYHRLIPDPNKILKGESVTLIQHPGGARRQLAIRDNKVITEPHESHFLWYESDTAQGSSGAPAFNDSFQIVALHHSGRAKKENGLYVLKDGRKVASLEGIDDSNVNWIANEGVRVSVLCQDIKKRLKQNNEYVRQLFSAIDGSGDIMFQALTTGSIADSDPSSEIKTSDRRNDIKSVSEGANEFVVPIRLHISTSVDRFDLSTFQPSDREKAVAEIDISNNSTALVKEGLEKMVQPFIDTDYPARKGYQSDFLGIEVPLPTVSDTDIVSILDNGEYIVPYEHFSIIINKSRRLALLCGSNIDGTSQMRKPEDARDYSRKGLSGLGKNDQEKWKTDPRIPELHQLPDKFYNKDGKAFDKGHIIRREDVCWGKSFETIRRANGDTYHTTNCSPQTASFNRSPGIWGALENYILKQVKGEKGGKYSIFAGPVLNEDDDWFEGFDERGMVRLQIPNKFWKIVIARGENGLQAFAFILEQDLENVTLEDEFFVSEAWAKKMISIKDLEEIIGAVNFPQIFKDADQYDTKQGLELLKETGVSRY